MKLLHDTGLLFARNLRATLRFPIWALIGLFQPLCYLFLFAPLLNSISHVSGFPAGGAIAEFTPGILVLMSIFGSAYVGFGLIAELQAGVIERFRVTPVIRLALLLGLALRDALLLLVQSLLLVLIAVPLGLRVSFSGLMISFLLIALLGLFLSSCSYALALTLKDANALSSFLNTLTLPILLLSGILLPLTLAPPLIRALAFVDPFAYIVNAMRQLFTGNIAAAAVPQSFIIAIVLALAAMIWARNAFNRGT